MASFLSSGTKSTRASGLGIKPEVLHQIIRAELHHDVRRVISILSEPVADFRRRRLFKNIYPVHRVNIV